MNQQNEEIQNALAVARLLRNGASEIKNLRENNRLLSAKVEVVEVFKAALMGGNRDCCGGASSLDSTYEMERASEQIFASVEKARVATAQSTDEASQDQNIAGVGAS